MESGSLDEWLNHLNELLSPAPGTAVLDEKTILKSTDQIKAVYDHIARQKNRIEKSVSPVDLLPIATTPLSYEESLEITREIGKGVGNLPHALMLWVLDARTGVFATMCLVRKVRHLPIAQRIIEEKTSIEGAGNGES